MSRHSSLCHYLALIISLGLMSSCRPAQMVSGDATFIDYELVAAKQASVMQDGLNDAASRGFRFDVAMAAETTGGEEVVAILSRQGDTDEESPYEYLLITTSETSTMQKELQDAAEDGYRYRGHTAFREESGGREVAIILERDLTNSYLGKEYVLLGSSETSEMLEELRLAGEDNYQLLDLTVGSSQVGGNELLAIRRLSGEEEDWYGEIEADMDAADAGGFDEDDGDMMDAEAEEADVEDTESPEESVPYDGEDGG